VGAQEQPQARRLVGDLFRVGNPDAASWQIMTLSPSRRAWSKAVMRSAMRRSMRSPAVTSRASAASIVINSRASPHRSNCRARLSYARSLTANGMALSWTRSSSKMARRCA
jgi:hypothetical protein